MITEAKRYQKKVLGSKQPLQVSLASSYSRDRGGSSQLPLQLQDVYT